MSTDNLRALAEQAIPGWELDAAYLRRDEALDIDVAAYIAAANPAAILDLLDERDELRVMRDRGDAAYVDALQGKVDAERRVAALEAAMEKARALLDPAALPAEIAEEPSDEH